MNAKLDRNDPELIRIAEMAGSTPESLAQFMEGIARQMDKGAKTIDEASERFVAGFRRDVEFLMSGDPRAEAIREQMYRDTEAAILAGD